MSKLRQLIEAANRKCEMAWKVYSYNPEKDNELVDTSKAFDCIAAAQAHKRDILEKNPNYTVEIIAESSQKNEDFYKYIDDVPTREIAKALKELGIKEPYATQKAKIANLLAKRFGLRSVPTPIEMTSVLDALPYFTEESAQKNEATFKPGDKVSVKSYYKDGNQFITLRNATIIKEITEKEAGQLDPAYNWKEPTGMKYYLVKLDTGYKKAVLASDLTLESIQKSESGLKSYKELVIGDTVELTSRTGKQIGKITGIFKNTGTFDAGITIMIKNKEGKTAAGRYSQVRKINESIQKSESKVNMSKLKNEIQAAVNKYFKDDKDLLEYVHIDTKKDRLGRDILEVRAELGYNDMVKLADHLDKIVTKYDRYAYFDQETGGIMTAVFESAQKNEALTNKEIAEVFMANGFKMLYVDANHVEGKKGNTKVWTYMDEKKLSTSDEPYTKGNYPKGFSKDAQYAQINAKLPNNKKELSELLRSVKIESAQKNESLRDLNLELADDTNAIVASADKIRQRFEYRTLQNQSYDEKQAEKIYLEVRRELEKAKKTIDACYNKIG